ncbi:MAG TPA: hypothetical protein VGH53_27280 [Streptosporangiaceae bacterium]
MTLIVTTIGAVSTTLVGVLVGDDFGVVNKPVDHRGPAQRAPPAREPAGRRITASAG